MAAISYDSVEILSSFAKRLKITFPLLADPDSQIIRQFGIVNISVSREDPLYGFSYAGSYVVDKQGIVRSKYFNELNNDRTTISNILLREFDDLPDNIQGRMETDHLRLSWAASNPSLKSGQRVALLLNVELKPGMHVYSPEVKGYIPIDWSLDDLEAVEIFPVEYPPSERLHLPAIDETVPVYHDSFMLLRNIRIVGGRHLPAALRGREALTVEGSFRYQACDEAQCYFPVTLPLTWTFPLQEHDQVRVPEQIRRNGSR